MALITGFPDETKEDLRSTIHYFADSLRFDCAEPQISLLAPLAMTPLATQYKDSLEFDNIFSDMSHQGWRQDPIELEMIKIYPDIFTNFYAIPTAFLERRYFKDIHGFISHLPRWSRWLPVVLLNDCGDLLAVFDRWREWGQQDNSLLQKAGVPYYCSRQFGKDFFEFVQKCYVPEMATAPDVVSAFVTTEQQHLTDATDPRRRRNSARDLCHRDSECRQRMLSLSIESRVA